jgi:phytoene synthase
VSRPQLAALYSFEAEIRDTVAAAHEVAHARLQWWRGEIERLATGHPGHPVTVALLPLRGHPGFDPQLLHEMLVAADLDLARFTYQNWRELDAYCFRAAGALQTLLAAALAGRRALSTSERAFARRLGSALRQTEMLRDFHVDLAAGRLRAPV